MVKQIEVEIAGTTDLMMHSAKGMLMPKEPKIEKKIKNVIVDATKEAEKVAYRSQKGLLFVPSSAIKGCILNASKFKKAVGASGGRRSLKPLVASGIQIEPEEIILPKENQKYAVDIRTAVNRMAGRIIVYRPRIPNWKLKFVIHYNENLLDSSMIKELLEEAGQTVGILSFSPRNNGSFGCFKVSKFEVEE